MKKRITKIMTSILCVCMIVTSIPVTTNASYANKTDVTTETKESIIETEELLAK